MKGTVLIFFLAITLKAAPIVVTTPIPIAGHGELFSNVPFVEPYYMLGFSGSNGADSVLFCCESGSGAVLAGSGVAGRHEAEGDYFMVDGVMSGMTVLIDIANNQITRLLSYDEDNNLIADVSVIGYFSNESITAICSGPLGCSGSETTFDISPSPGTVPEPTTVFPLIAAGRRGPSCKMPESADPAHPELTRVGRSRPRRSAMALTFSMGGYSPLFTTYL